MKKFVIGFFFLLFAIPIVFIYWVFTTIPGDVVARAEGLLPIAEELKRNIQSKKEGFEAEKKSPEFQFFRKYAEQEKWDSFFERAQQSLNQIEKANYTDIILPILDRNDIKDTKELEKQIGIVDEEYRKINDLLLKTERRKLFLTATKENAKYWGANARQLVGKGKREVELLNQHLKRAQKEHPHKTEDLRLRYVPLQKMNQKLSSGMQIVSRELRQHPKPTTDYALLGDGVIEIRKNYAELQKLEDQFKAKSNELDNSYSYILQDMRVQYYVQIGRTSWNAYSDYNTDQDHLFPPILISLPIYNFFVSSSYNSALYKKVLTGEEIQVEDFFWKNKDNIMSTQVRFPSDHDAMEFWLNDIFRKTYHKYTLIGQDGKMTRGNWVEVDEEDFDEMISFLGMEIKSKPRGSYEEEKLNEAAPPGMGYVGDSHYGDWKQDSSGETYWHWQPHYAFYYDAYGYRGNNYYIHQRDWKTWNQNYKSKGAYFGGTKANPKYGTLGSHTRSVPSIQASSFLKSGSDLSHTSSIRNAANLNRGGGPGSRGK